MPIVVPDQEFQQIIDLIALYPNGVGVDELAQKLGARVPRRTLQRRLAALVKQKRIFPDRAGRAFRYRVGAPAGDVTGALKGEVAAEVYVPTSPEGEEIKTYVRQPRQQRKPVSYQLKFLEQYRPNQTAYLPESLRAQLHSLGRSPAGQTPAGTFARDILNRLLIDLSWASSRLEGNTYKRLRLENRYLDYRALAEACRVQYFWKRAGVKRCVADHFLRDQRDELEWIRRAVRTTELLPGDIGLSRAQMEHVAKAWLDGQLHYFIGMPGKNKGNKAEENRIKDETWAKRASVFFKAAIVVTIILAISHIFYAAKLGETGDIAMQLMMLAYGMLLACAGLIKVSNEVEAFAQQAKRYRRMGMAMAVARRRLNTALEKNEMAEAENVLLGAGRDALEESGGWLLLHRDRPVRVPLG